MRRFVDRCARCLAVMLSFLLLTPAFRPVDGFSPVIPSIKPCINLLRPQVKTKSASTAGRFTLLWSSPLPDSTTETNQPLKRVEKSDEEWKAILSPDAYDVLRKDGTEPPNTSSLNAVDKDEAGTFVCAGCGSPLFRPSAKFDSGTGWPSFYAPIDNDAVSQTVDFKLILPRTEVRCATCDGHLGHVFEDGPEPTGLRFCMNGVAMDFKKDEDDPDLAAAVAARQSPASATAFKPGVGQVLPGAIFNIAIGGFFFNSFASRLAMGESMSLLDAIPFFFSMYYGIQGFRSIGRLF